MQFAARFEKATTRVADETAIQKAVVKGGFELKEQMPAEVVKLTADQLLHWKSAPCTTPK